jgi:hypothetical protein
MQKFTTIYDTGYVLSYTDSLIIKEILVLEKTIYINKTFDTITNRITESRTNISQTDDKATIIAE